MKLFTWLIMVLSLTCASCNKDDVSIPYDDIVELEPCAAEWAPIFHPGEMEYGRAIGLKNCRPFMASALCNVLSADDHFFVIGLNTYEDWGGFFANKEFISLGARASGLGFWPLLLDSVVVRPDTTIRAGITYYHTVQDHDVFEYIFNLDTTYSRNGIFISKIDSITQYAEGWFEARFIIAPNLNTGSNPDTVTFTQCHFEAYEP